MTTENIVANVAFRLTKEIEGRRSMSRYVKDDPETALYSDALNAIGFLLGLVHDLRSDLRAMPLQQETDE